MLPADSEAAQSRVDADGNCVRQTDGKIKGTAIDASGSPRDREQFRVTRRLKMPITRLCRVIA